MLVTLLCLMAGFADPTEKLPDDSVTVTFEFVQYKTKQRPREDYHLTVEPAATIEVDAKPGQPFSSRVRVGLQKYTCSGIVTRSENGAFVLQLKASSGNEDGESTSKTTISLPLGQTKALGGTSTESMVEGEAFTTYSGSCLRVKVARKEPDDE
jgi:hypothetical protein